MYTTALNCLTIMNARRVNFKMKSTRRRESLSAVYGYIRAQKNIFINVSIKSDNKYICLCISNAFQKYSKANASSINTTIFIWTDYHHSLSDTKYCLYSLHKSLSFLTKLENWYFYILTRNWTSGLTTLTTKPSTSAFPRSMLHAFKNNT